MKKDGALYSNTELENLDIKKYTMERNKWLLALLLGMNGKSFDELGEDLPKITSTMESLYNLCTASIQPFR